MNSARRVYFSSVAANVTSPSRNGLSRCERIFFHLSFSFSSVLFDSFTVLLLLASDLNNDGVGQPDVDLASYACTVHKWAKVSERSLLQLVLPDAKMVEKKQTSHKTTRDNMSKNIISSLDPFGEIFCVFPLSSVFSFFFLPQSYFCLILAIRLLSLSRLFNLFCFFSSSSSRLHLFCFASSIAGRDRAMETRPGCCQCCAYGGTLSSEFLGAHLEAAAAGAGPSVKQLQYVFISRLASLPYRPFLDNSCWTAQRICIFAGILVTHHRPAEGLVADDDEGRRAGLESKSGCDK